ncbi:hypothetical protein [Mycoplasmopsis fermentans]|nr:hypothetical protein [Mycoplasmopsis fermentans]
MKRKNIVIYFKDKEEYKTFKQVWKQIPNKSEYIKQILKEFKK